MGSGVVVTLLMIEAGCFDRDCPIFLFGENKLYTQTRAFNTSQFLWIRPVHDGFGVTGSKQTDMDTRTDPEHCPHTQL